MHDPMFENSAPLLVRFLICFVIGSIPFAVVSMMGSGVDIRKVGSGNPGFNNVLRVSSRRAVAALVGDMGKGVLAVWLVLYAWPAHLPRAWAQRAWAQGAWAGVAWAASHPVFPAHPVFPVGIALGWSYGLAAVLGHCFSPFLRFKGGKGIATSGGVMLVLYPVWAVIALAYFTAARVAGGKLKWRGGRPGGPPGPRGPFFFAVFLFFARHHPSKARALLKCSKLLLSVPAMIGLDFYSRTLFNEIFYREYRGMKKEWLQELEGTLFERVIRPSIYAGAKDVVEADRAQGFRPVLVTGELDVALAAVVRYFAFDAVISNSLVYENGAATGKVVPPLIAEAEKVAAIARLCRQWNASLPDSKAYSDSFSDAPMLESVGNPVAVNPDRRLKRVAQSRGWPILELKRSAGRGDGRWAVAALEGDHDGHPR